MLKKLPLILLMLFIAGIAEATNTPRYLNYQAVLFDDGGNPLPDGPATLYIKILDSNLSAVFEEEQEVEVISGVVSLMIGNGVDPASGAPTGGIGADVLLPDGPRYLEIQAEGYPAENLMELVSVPYATYADVAFKVADESVGADQIREKSITINHLTDELVSELGSQIVGGDQITIVKKEEFNEYKNEIFGSGGARNVGVNPDFTYTSASNLQDVLKDLDFAVKKREEDVGWEKVQRQGSDETLQGNIDTEATTRQGADTTLQSNINSEATTRQSADTTLQSNIDSEVTTRQSADTTLQNNIDSEAAIRQSADNTLQGNVDSEATARQSADQTLQNNIAALEADIAVNPSLPMIAKGRILNWGVIDEDYTDTDCLISGTTVVCKLSSTEGTSCGMHRQIIPQFEVSTNCSTVDHSVPFFPSAMIPINFIHSISKWHTIYEDAYYCDEVVSFDINPPTCSPPNGVNISWKLYERSLP